jgi:hypothetical protein
MAREALDTEQINAIRQARDVVPYTVYDSIVIGQGASKRDPGWYEDFQTFAASNSLLLFAGRQGSVGPSYTNMRDPRRDWAMAIEMMHIQFLASAPGLSDYLSSPFDAQLLPSLWCDKMASMMTFNLGVGDLADNLLNLPCDHVPAGYGPAGGVLDGSSSPSMSAITNGSPHASNFFGWSKNSPLELAAKSKLDLNLQVSDPIKSLMLSPAFPKPGEIVIANNGEEARAPLYYTIKVSFVGRRALQLRGGRSA